MVGCNCSKPAGVTASDPCCIAMPQGEDCVTPIPRDYYCGFCESSAPYVSCQVWIDLCSVMRIATTLATTRFKTQIGRDAVFGILKFESANQFSKYDRFGPGIHVNLNTPLIFDCLCSIAAAASFRDRIGEKTRYNSRGNVVRTKQGVEQHKFDSNSWGFSDASTAYHKNIVLLRGLLRRYAMSQSQFETMYGLTWLPAGSATMYTGETPVLGQMNSALVKSPFGIFTDGAFAVVDKEPGDTLKFDDTYKMYPVHPWDTPLACDGFVIIPRPTGKADVVPYHYSCRKFEFENVSKSMQGDKKSLEDFAESARQYYKKEHGEDLKCNHWLQYFLPVKKAEGKPDDKESGGGSGGGSGGESGGNSGGNSGGSGDPGQGGGDDPNQGGSGGDGN